MAKNNRKVIAKYVVTTYGVLLVS